MSLDRTSKSLFPYPTLSNYKGRPFRPEHRKGGQRFGKKLQRKVLTQDLRVTIITVVRNGEPYLEQTIQSVLNQTYPNIEYIIIDGDSTDGTLDLIKKYDDQIDFWLSEPDEGIYDAMNKGISVSSGVLINLLNADDYLEPGAVQFITAEYLKINQPAVIYGNAYYIDDTYSVKAKFYSHRKPWLGMTINHQAMFVHKWIYESIGLYNSKYKLTGDYDFFVRCVKNNVVFIRLNECIVSCRNAGATLQRTKYSRREGNLINKEYYGLSKERVVFILFNYLWAPIKLRVRTILYRLVGVKLTRKLISVYKSFRYSI